MTMDISLSNFRRTKTTGNSLPNQIEFGDVDVTTVSGMLWWKRTSTVRRQICRQYGGGLWFFVDTGEFTPGFQAEALVRAWDAQHA